MTPGSAEALSESPDGSPSATSATVRSRRRRSTLVPILLVAPAAAGTIVLVYLPVALALGAGFFDIPITGRNVQWAGIDNFVALLTDTRVHRAALNTLTYGALTIVPSVVIGLSAALALNRIRRGRALVSTLLFLPLTANLVAMAVVFRWIFSAPDGFVNYLIGFMGIGPVDFLGRSDTALLTVALVGVWRSVSFAMVLFLAGLTTIPPAVNEAAAMDGVRGLKKTLFVTIPMLRTTLVLVIVLITIQSVQVFDTVNVMTNGGPDGASETMFTLIQRTGFSYLKLGEASALTLIVLVVLIGFGMLRRRQIMKGTA